MPWRRRAKKGFRPYPDIELGYLAAKSSPVTSLQGETLPFLVDYAERMISEGLVTDAVMRALARGPSSEITDSCHPS